MPNKQQIIYY